MNCSESQRRIYCYRELNDRERDETDRHLQTCASCREVMENANAGQRVIEAWRKHAPLPSNEARMTSRTMAAVGKEQARRAPAWHGSLQKFGMPSLRYGMAAISFLLIVSFLGEYAKDGEGVRLTKYYPMTAGQKTELNLASFHSAFLTAKKNDQRNSVSISQCVRKCLHNESLDCADCVDKYSKP